MSQPFGDTWEWDGSSWTSLTVSGPSPRFGAAAATANGKVVLFGGAAPSPSTGLDVYYGDTWEWDGARWSERNVVGPQARAGAAATTRNGTMVLFGGGSNVSAPMGGFIDTWEWDGTAWRQRETLTVLFAVNDATMASLNGNAVLYSSGTTFEWDGTRWTQEQVAGPPGRTSAAAATVLGSVILFGGRLVQTSSLVGETWAWNGSAWSQLRVQGPTPRQGMAMSGF